MAAQSDNDDDYIPQQILDIANEAVSESLPQKSMEIYKKTYDDLVTWMEQNETKSFLEPVLMAYFKELSKRLSPNTLWAKYSMIAAMVNQVKNIDIKQYLKLKTFIKQKNVGFTPKKAKFFTSQEVNDFLSLAPDSRFLVHKVALALGLAAACRRDDLYNLTFDNVKKQGSVYTFTLSMGKTNVSRVFAVEGQHTKVLDRYIQLRPSDCTLKNFFLHYQGGKCTKQPIGIHKIGNIPKEMAMFLNLTDVELYTGNSFRRTSATIYNDSRANITDLKRHGGWRSRSVAEGYIEDSIINKRKTSRQIFEAIDDTSDQDEPPRKLLNL